MPLTLVFQTISSQSDIWQDPYAPAWIGIIVGAVGIAVAIWAAMYQVRKQRIKREIIYQKISEAPIVTVNNDIATRVEVLVDGKPAKGVWLLVFEVKNVESGAVKGEDYFEPLTFHFDGEVIGGISTQDIRYTRWHSLVAGKLDDQTASRAISCFSPSVFFCQR